MKMECSDMLCVYIDMISHNILTINPIPFYPENTDG